jgi:ATP-binding cassette, subfamily C, bacteriocin exporter
MVLFAGTVISHFICMWIPVCTTKKPNQMKKSIQVKQRDFSDCGAACLTSVAAYYGLLIPVSRIRQMAGTGIRGTSLSGLISAAERMNFQARAARAAGIAIPDIPFPAIFHMVLDENMQHFVVVYKVKKGMISFMDPAHGKLISRSIGEFEKSWSGVLILLRPSDHFKEGNERKSPFQRFWQLILPHRSLLFQALMGAIVYTVLGLSTSVYVQKIIDSVLPDANKKLINLLSLLMMGILFFRVLAGYFRSMLALHTGRQIDSRLILGYYKHLLELPQRFFDSMRVGEIISRVNDAIRIRVFINDVALSLIIQGLTLILSMTVMFLFYWKLALIILSGMFLYIFIYLISNQVNARWQRKTMESGAALESQLVETLQGVTTIRRFCAQDWFSLKTENRFIPLMQAMFTSNRYGLLLSYAAECITGLLTISILWAGSYLVIDRMLTAGELLSLYTLIAFFTGPVQVLIGANRSMQDALIAADRLFEIIDLETEKENRENSGTDRFPEGDLLFENVHFTYNPGNQVFRGLELCIPRNQMTAVLGESGCGKSTLLSLIQKLYLPDQGIIRIGETDIQYVSTPLLRNRIAAVPQQTDLFLGDFISNIALGEHEPDKEKIFDICSRLGLHEWISRLPSRYHTVIREQGINLSGGQKQRLGIARAVYRDPDILILDEATSSLDPENEGKVLDTLRWFHKGGKTVIVIAHRLSTIKHCDGIILLSGGRKAICGTHQDLLAENKEYQTWWTHHFL